MLSLEHKKRKLEDDDEHLIPSFLSPYLDITPGFLVSTPDETKSIIDFMRHKVKASPNPRNPSTFLRRKQCTFVLPDAQEYDFGQFNEHFRSSKDKWPPLVRRAFDQVRSLCTKPEFFTAVHVNLYEDGGVGVAPHSDKEDSMVKGLPIFSITLLEDPDHPRPFSIYQNDAVKICDVPLCHGDLLVMNQMQDDFKHGIEKHRPFKMYRSRINFTIRAMRPHPEQDIKE